MVFNQCEVSQGSDGKNYVLSGTGITVSGNSVWTVLGTGQNFDISTSDNFSIIGNIDVTGSESMTCDIQLSATDSGNDINGVFTGSGNYTGTICGQAENGPVTPVVSSSSNGSS